MHFNFQKKRNQEFLLSYKFFIPHLHNAMNIVTCFRCNIFMNAFHLENNRQDKKVYLYHQGVKRLGELRCFIKSEGNCEPEDYPANCNGESNSVRKEFKENGTDFCKPVANDSNTKQEDCAKVTFENGSTHLTNMQENYHFVCHKYFLR